MSYISEFVTRFPPDEPLVYIDVLTFIQELQDKKYLNENDL